MPLRMGQSHAVERPTTSMVHDSVRLITPPSAFLLDERVCEHSMGQGPSDFIHLASRGDGVRKLG
jgi:hypothetical protein